METNIMQREHITKYLWDVYGTKPEYLWTRYPTYSVFRHPSSKKWYAIIMDVPKNKLGLNGDDIVTILDVKCDSLMIGSLLSEKGFFPAYHMNKNSWISVLLDESVPDERIIPLLEFGYDSVTPKRKKKDN